MAMFSTFVAWGLYEAGVPIALAALTTIGLSFVAGMVIERVLIRHFEGGEVLTLVIVTLGLFIFLNGLAGWIWGFGNRGFPSLFSEDTVELGGVQLSVESLGIVGVLLGVVGLLFLLFQKTKLGLAMRAAALNPASSALVGVRVGHMLMLGWGLAAALGALAGVLVAPRLFLDVNLMGAVLIYAFAAAALGGFDSAIVAVVALVVPFLFGPYRVGQFTLVLVYAVAVLGLNLLVGYSGQISLGHGAFFALGAYTAAPAAGALCFVAGFLFGVPALRLHGLYLALVTLGLAIALPQLIKRFDGLTEGTQGLTVEQPTAPGWLPLEDDQFLYLLCLVLAAVMFLLAWNLMRGQVGRAGKAVRDGQIPASTLGVDLAATKTRVFAVSSAYAGVAGALYVFAIGFVAPEAFPLPVSFAFLAAIVVGGLATISGALFGALFIEFVPVWASDVNDALTGVIYGGVLIAFMWVLPEGAAGLWRRGRRLRQREEPRRRDWDEK